MSGRYVPSSAQGAPPDALVRRVEDAVGERSADWRKPDTGLTPAHRFQVRFASGRRLFVKAATTAETSAMLRNERLALEVAPQDFAPEIFAWLEDVDAPVLLVEDHSHAHWPASHAGVNWRPGDVERVIEAVRAMAGEQAPRALPAIAGRDLHWPKLLDAPERFLELGLCSPAWLRSWGPTLAAAERDLDQSGTALVHGDVRSDNICLTKQRVVFVDWSHAGAGAPGCDLASFLPAAHLEGAPPPERLWPEGGAWGAAQAAAIAVRAMDDRDAPAWLRRVFRRLAQINLAWAAAGLKAPAPSS